MFLQATGHSRLAAVSPFLQGWTACFLGDTLFLNHDKDLRSIRWGSPQDWSPKLGIEPGGFVLSCHYIPSRA